MARSSLIVAALAFLVILVQAAVAQVPVQSGAYRIVSVAEGTTVRPQAPGSPFYVPAGGSPLPPGSISDVFDVLGTANGDYLIKAKTHTLYARSTSTFVTLNQQGSIYRLEAVGSGAFVIKGKNDNLAWTVQIGNLKSIVSLRTPSGSSLQQFRFVRA